MLRKFLIVVLAALIAPAAALAQKTPDPKAKKADPRMPPRSLPGYTYCCADTTGKKVCADSFPAQCVARAYSEISPQGAIKRHPAPPTAEEAAKLEVEEIKKQQEEKVIKDKQRKDKALLVTYANVKEIDTQRERVVKEQEKEIAKLLGQKDALLKKHQTLEAEAKAAKEPLAAEKAGKALKHNEAELKSQQEVIDTKNRELEGIKAKYDEEKRRYLEITGGTPAPAPAAATAPAVSAATKPAAAPAPAAVPAPAKPAAAR